MKKLILFSILSLSLLAIEHGKFELNIHKDTNGSYVYKLPHYESTEYNGYFITEEVVDLIFTSERGNLTVPNHHSVFVSKSFGLSNKDFYTTFSIDLQYFFEENSDNIEEGLQFGNTLKFGYQW